MPITREDLVIVLTKALKNLAGPGKWRGYKQRRRIEIDPDTKLAESCVCMWVHVDRECRRLVHSRVNTLDERIFMQQEMIDTASRLIVQALPSDYVPSGPKDQPAASIIWKWNDHSQRTRQQVEQVMTGAIRLAETWNTDPPRNDTVAPAPRSRLSRGPGMDD